VEYFPAIVANDAHGGDLFTRNRAAYQKAQER
jgi:tartrate dehydratase beta subunit/fumarate hydratase class I family protein